MKEVPASDVRLSFGGPLTPVVKILIIINSIAFVLMRLTTIPSESIYALLGLAPEQLIEQRAIWQLVTYMFVHDASWMHILFNMLVLWWFGSELERAWGGTRFLRYYLTAGIVAGLAVVCTELSGLAPSATTIGASGAIMALLVAFGTTFPDRVLLFMFIIPVKAKYLALLTAGLEMLSLAASTSPNVSHAAHFGGLLFGFGWYLYFNGRFRLNTWRRILRRRRRRGRLKLVQSAAAKSVNGDDDLPTTVH